MTPQNGGSYLRKRSRRAEVCFTKSEFLDMIEKAQKAHLSAGDFIRGAVNGLEIKEAPSADILTLIQEIRRIGCNIEKILKIANAAVEKLIVDNYITSVDRYGGRDDLT